MAKMASQLLNNHCNMLEGHFKVTNKTKKNHQAKEEKLLGQTIYQLKTMKFHALFFIPLVLFAVVTPMKSMCH